MRPQGLNPISTTFITRPCKGRSSHMGVQSRSTLTADRCLHHLWNRHELESLGLRLWNQQVCRDNCLRTIRTHGSVTSIVQEDHVTTANLAPDPLFDFIRGIAPPILAAHVPHHRDQSKRSGNTQSSWPAATEGRTKQRRVLANSLHDGLLAFLQLGSGLP